TKIITISILGLLLLVPFMMPTKAAPAPYIPVEQGEYYEWEMSQGPNFAQFFTDDMSDRLAALFYTPPAWTIGAVWIGWEWDTVTPQSRWPLTVLAFEPENTSIFLSDYFIFDNITHTAVNLSAGYWVIHYPISDYFYNATWYIVNDTASFAAQSLYGGVAFSPYTLQGVPFAPKNINWTEFVAIANWGMAGNYYVGDAVNTTVTALSNGYSISVPALGFGNNTLAISISVTYENGILDTYTFEYGTDLLFEYLESIDPITDSPSDFAVAWDYTGQSITWTPTDRSPDTYTISLDGSPVVTATAWTNGTPITYNIPDGLTPGAAYTYSIGFTDTAGNTVSDGVDFTVNAIPDSVDPVITSSPSDLAVSAGYTGQSVSWTATDSFPATYTIKSNGSLVVVSATAWTNGTPVTYNIPDE
ncbi:hypothetical protein LCGC14_2773560, partial [marine sediment metagenome]